MADIADDGLVFHGRHVFVTDDVFVAGGRHKNVGLVCCVFHGDDFVTFHRRLQGVDRIHFGHPHLGRQGAQSLGTALAHVAVTGHQGDLAGDHHVGGAFDGVHQGLAATVQIVKLALGDGIVHIDGAQLQRAFGRHFIQAVHARGGFFGDADDVLQTAAVPGRIDLELGLDGVEQANFLLAGRFGDDFQVFFGQ